MTCLRTLVYGMPKDFGLLHAWTLNARAFSRNVEVLIIRVISPTKFCR